MTVPTTDVAALLRAAQGIGVMLVLKLRPYAEPDQAWYAEWCPGNGQLESNCGTLDASLWWLAERIAPARDKALIKRKVEEKNT